MGNGSFTVQEFCYSWMKSRNEYRKAGGKTDSKGLRRDLKAITQWCKEHRHRTKQKQSRELTAKVPGHTAYGLSLNCRRIKVFQEHVKRIWFKWLNRRSAKRRPGSL
jgi:hypothetical protein